MYTANMSHCIENNDARLKTLKLIAAEALSTSEADIAFKNRPQLDIQSNNLYEASNGGQRIILKEFLKPDEFDESPLREFRALRLLSHLDIAPQPRAFYPLNSDHNPIVVYDYMDGKMWDRKVPSARELEQLVNLWIQMNEVQSDDLWLSRSQETSTFLIWQSVKQQFGDYSEWVENSFPLAGQAAKLAIDLWQEREETALDLTKFEIPLCFCRSDPRFANVISRPDGRLGMVDWEDSGLRDPALDLADIMIHPNQEDLLTHHQWRSFHRPYLEYRRRRDLTLDRRFHLYLGLLPVWWLSILLGEGVRKYSAGQLDQWRIHGMDPNRKLGRYLARALTWPDYDFNSMDDELADICFFPDS